MLEKVDVAAEGEALLIGEQLDCGERAGEQVIKQVSHQGQPLHGRSEEKHSYSCDRRASA